MHGVTGTIFAGWTLADGKVYQVHQVLVPEPPIKVCLSRRQEKTTSARIAGIPLRPALGPAPELAPEPPFPMASFWQELSSIEARMEASGEIKELQDRLAEQKK